MLRGSRYAAGIVLCCLLLTCACSPGAVTAATKVTVTGSVVDASGAPIPGASVLLIDTAAGNPTATATPGPGPLALSCFQATTDGTAAHEPCTSARQATTDRTGAYSFTVNGAETQDSTGSLITFVAASFLPARPGHPAEAGTSAAFQIGQPDVTVPTLRSWGASVITSTVAGQLVATWPGLPRADGTSPTSSLDFVDAAGAVVWTSSGA
ncbi:MAG TPA: hypothetical protein VKY26_03880, partial [Actinomycetota bacterium]|nr:hypothetical protein [Actinomycetota bacterium]